MSGKTSTDPMGETNESDAPETPSEEAVAPEAPSEETADDPALELEQLKDKWLRAMAELENVRRRARLDVEEARLYGTSALLVDVLTVVDDLNRALSAPPDSVDTAFLDGLRLIESQWKTMLDRYGVEPVPAQRGQPLDPTVHRALMEQEDEELEPGTIHTEIVRGFKCHDRLLREAQVVVSKAPANEPAED